MMTPKYNLEDLMMALISCPECKKEVSNQAESCPNCGYDLTVKGKWYDKTGFIILWIFLFWPVGLYGLFKNKKIKKPIKAIVGSVVGLFGLLIIIGIFSPDTVDSQSEGVSNDSTTLESAESKSNEELTSTDIPIESKNSFDFTVEEYVNLFNQSMTTIGQDKKIKIKEENDNDQNLTIQYSINDYLGMVATASRDNRKIDSLILIGSGDGSVESGTDIILGALATVMAVENPEMGVDQRGEIGNKLGLLDGSLVEIGEKEYISESNTFKASFTEGIGLMLSAEPND